MIYVVVSVKDNSIVAVFDRELTAQVFVKYTYKGAPYKILEFGLNEFIGETSYWKILYSVDDNQWVCQRRFGVHRYDINDVTVKTHEPLLLQVFVKADSRNIALEEGKILIEKYLHSS